MLTQVFLFFVALLGGGLNAVAGGGSFFTLPALIYAGVSPVMANATSTFAMWPASLASAVAYRREIGLLPRWLVGLSLVSLVGGFLGGELLVKTSDSRFLALLPWLMLVAVATFTVGGRIGAWARRREARAGVATVVDSGSRPLPPWILVFQLVVAIYGGYFGGGMGIMMLAAMSVAGLVDIHEMNGLKTVLAVAINGVALLTFVLDDAIAWRPGLVMLVGGVTGGYVGAAIARQLSASSVRLFVIVVGWALTAYFFVR